MAHLAVVAAALVLLLLHISYPAAGARVPKQHLAVGGGGAASLCRRTDYPALCMSAAQSLHAGPATGTAVLEMNIRAAIEKINGAEAQEASLRSSALLDAKDTMAKGNLDTCQQSYDNALADLQQAMKALKSGATHDLQTSLSAVITHVVTCDDGFADAGTNSPLSRADDDARKLASNGLALASLVNQGH